MAFSASMVAGLGTNILNREKSFTRRSTFPCLAEFNNPKFEAAIKQIETDLKAPSGQVGPVRGVFIILKVVGPLLWCPISEIKGRKVKIPYPVSTRFLSVADSFPKPVTVYCMSACVPSRQSGKRLTTHPHNSEPSHPAPFFLFTRLELLHHHRSVSSFAECSLKHSAGAPPRDCWPRSTVSNL
jgi:hypothetical protein